MLAATEHWCANCDCHMVDSTKPETGKFYSPFGHQRSGYKEETGVEYNGDYRTILFAICCNCSLLKYMEKHSH